MSLANDGGCAPFSVMRCAFVWDFFCLVLVKRGSFVELGFIYRGIFVEIIIFI